MGLRLGLGKAEEDRRYTAAENIVRKRLEVEVQADEDAGRTLRREVCIVLEPHKGLFLLIRDVSRLLAWASAPGHILYIVQHLPRLRAMPAVQCANACLIIQLPCTTFLSLCLA